MEKMTNVKALNYVLANADLPEEVANKLVAMRDGYVKKAENKKPTKEQVANEGYKVAVAEYLAGVEKATATEIANAVEGVGTPQKAVALVKMLIADGKAVKETDKKKVYYKAVG